VTESLAFFGSFRDPSAALSKFDRLSLTMLDEKHPVPFCVARRRFLRGVLIGVPAAVALGGPGKAFAAAVEIRSIELTNTHTGEQVAVGYFRAGTYREDSLAALNHLLRDHRSGDVAQIDRRLFDLLHDVAVLAGREPRFEVISGYRSPVTNAMLNARSNGVAKHSLHMEGRAVDVRLAGYRTDRLRDLALALKTGGVGFYRKSDFVHVDTGRVRTWAG
jgi:uncharacterized protein YcbK (DUF882 family)